jgi:lysophospholipase L1-like esterase
MRTVLCYGDSNTWGYDPATRARYPPHVRWSGVLASRLGAEYRVVEEGLNGRTTRWDDPIESGRNGPLDVIIVMLGTNDLKRRFDLSASDIAQSAAALGELAWRFTHAPDGSHAEVLLIAPPAVSTLTEFDQMFDGAREKSRWFSHYYRLAAGWHHLAFFDAGSVIVSSEKDGIHFDAEEHRKLGEALADEVRRLVD